MKKDSTQTYGYYSKLLSTPFDTLAELKEAEEAYLEKEKAKEDKAAQKKADALKVEDAFKQLNAARRAFKTDLETLTETYRKNLQVLKANFEEAKDVIYETLSEAEENYSDALRAFTEKYPEGYHITLKDGDFETTISKESSMDSKPANNIYQDIFDLFFRN